MNSKHNHTQQQQRQSDAGKHRQGLARIRNYFLTGLLVVVPLGVTFFVFKFLIGLADGMLRIIPQPFQDTYPLFKIPGLGLLITLSLVMVIGFLARNFVGRKLVAISERLIVRIPLLRSVYSASKQLMETIFAGTGDHFKRVVLIEYPRKGISSLGFVIGHAGGFSSDLLSKPHLNVFIPTTPNPTSGWYILVPEQDAIPVNISVEDAFKAIISAGMVMPNHTIDRIDSVPPVTTDSTGSSFPEE